MRSSGAATPLSHRAALHEARVTSALAANACQVPPRGLRVALTLPLAEVRAGATQE